MKETAKRSSQSKRFTTKTEIETIILSIFMKIASQTSKKQARLLIAFIIIMLMF